VVAVGCLAERYGATLAEELPEAAAVLGFDDYPDIAARLHDVLAGVRPASHAPRDRRTLLPVTPVHRPGAGVSIPGHAASAGTRPDGAAARSGPRLLRRRLDAGPVAPLKLASGCDRRCAFCAIPRFRGAFVSRDPEDVLAEGRWLADGGVRELLLVSENSTSYGKDLGDLRALEKLLPRLAGLPGIARVRVNYLQPAELRPSLVDVLTATPGVAPYFDLSFQHASGRVLRRMRRFGDGESFLDLLDRIRSRMPDAGVRTNVIVGFPGEEDADVAVLEDFLVRARLDAVGVFGYSDEDGTEAATYDGKLPDHVVAERCSRVSELAELLCPERAEDRVGAVVDVLVESVSGRRAHGRAAHQAPEDGHTALPRGDARGRRLAVGDLVAARVVAAEGVDLLADPLVADAVERKPPGG
jgi:MiaB/RimO family radical SAM methylthiotransferase